MFENVNFTPRLTDWAELTLLQNDIPALSPPPRLAPSVNDTHTNAHQRKRERDGEMRRARLPAGCTGNRVLQKIDFGWFNTESEVYPLERLILLNFIITFKITKIMFIQSLYRKLDVFA